MDYNQIIVAALVNATPSSVTQTAFFGDTLGMQME